MCDNNHYNSLFSPINKDMIDINDDNSLEETNDIYEETVSKFDLFYDEAKSLKSSIEDYISEINKSAKRTFRQMNKAFRSEHYYISKTRYDLKNEFTDDEPMEALEDEFME